MGNERKNLSQTLREVANGFVNRRSRVQISKSAPEGSASSHTEGFREAITRIHQEARESLDRVADDLDPVGLLSDASSPIRVDVDAIRAALDLFFSELMSVPNEDQAAAAIIALERIGTPHELGSDRRLVIVTLSGVDLDGTKDAPPKIEEVLPLVHARTPVIKAPECCEEGCSQLSTHRYFWPGRVGCFACETHTIAAVKLHAAMGFGELRREKLELELLDECPATERAS